MRLSPDTVHAIAALYPTRGFPFCDKYIKAFSSIALQPQMRSQGKKIIIIEQDINS